MVMYAERERFEVLGTADARVYELKTIRAV